MTVESASFISQLNPAYPAAGDPKSEGDDHMRLIKAVLQGQFPNLGATAITAIAAEINALVGATTTGATALKVVTQVLSDNGLNAASTAFVQGLVAAAIGSGSAAPVWVSGTTYSVGNTVYSPITFQTYRRKIAGAGTTDPSLDTTNWQVLSSTIGTGGQTITGNVTLTSASGAAITVTPTAPGLYATLPDATTLSTADNLFAIYNAGDYDYGVKDSTGTQLGWVRARTGAMIGLSDKSTAAGVWAYYGLEKTGITASYVNSTLANMGNTIRRIALDANRTCFLFGGTDCYAIVYDASTQTWGSATLIQGSGAVTSGQFLGVLSTTNQVLVCYLDTSNNLQAVTLSISSTTVTVNTKVPAALGSAGSSVGQLIAVGSSWVVSYNRATNVTAIRALTVSGTTPTIGAESIVNSSISANGRINLFASGSIVRCVYFYGSGTGTQGTYCAPYTVSGSTLTLGTAASGSVSASSTSNSFRAFLNGNGNIVCHYIDTTHFATIFKLTGTVEAASSVSLGTVPTNITSATDYVAVTASKTAFCYNVGGTTWFANILTDTAGTATAGTEISGTFGTTLTYVAGIAASGNTARFATGSNGNYGQLAFDCSGSSPVLSSYQQVTATSSLMGFPAASDIYGVRIPKALIAGQTMYALSGATGPYDQQIGTNAISRRIAVPLSTNPGTGGVAASSSESAIAAVVTGTTGFFINRVEAAQ